MSDCISREDAKNYVIGRYEDQLGFITMEDIIDQLDYVPTIDAVEVVRCSQCKHRMHLEGATDVAWECALRYGLPGVIAEEDYCSYGEREEYNHE